MQNYILRHAAGVTLTYADFKAEVKRRFWKDSDTEIKYAQWEKLHELNFPDSDLFFQKFEARILSNKWMMCAQIKKAAHETSKNTIYVGNETIAATFQEWKDHLLHIDYNWQLRKVENMTSGWVGDNRALTQKVTTPQKNSQQSTGTPEKKTETSMTYGGQGAPMDIDRAHAKVNASNVAKSAISSMMALMAPRPGKKQCEDSMIIGIGNQQRRRQSQRLRR